MHTHTRRIAGVLCSGENDTVFMFPGRCCFGSLLWKQTTATTEFTVFSAAWHRVPQRIRPRLHQEREQILVWKLKVSQTIRHKSHRTHAIPRGGGASGAFIHSESLNIQVTLFRFDHSQLLAANWRLFFTSPLASPHHHRHQSTDPEMMQVFL